MHNKNPDLFEQFTPQNRKDWRDWLAVNHDRAKGVWLVFYKKQSGQVKITYAEAVEEALCFGWIDNRAHKLDADHYLLKFAPPAA